MRTLIIIAFICILNSACHITHTSGYNNSPSNIAVIKVEFRDEDSLRLTIVQLLKTSMVAEMQTSQHGSHEIIIAKYDNIPGGKAAEIEQQLTQMTGVIEVTVKWEELQAQPAQRILPKRFT